MSLQHTISYLPKRQRIAAVIFLLWVTNNDPSDTIPQKNLFNILNALLHSIDPLCPAIKKTSFQEMLKVIRDEKNIVASYAPKKRNNYHGNIYLITEEAKTMYPNMKKTLNKLIKQCLPDQEKNRAIVLSTNKDHVNDTIAVSVDKVREDWDNQHLEFLKEQFKDVKPEYLPKPRTNIPDNFALPEKDIDKLLHTWHRKDVYDVVAVVQHLTSYCRHNKTTSDDWNTFAINCVNRHFRLGWKKTEQRAYMLRISAAQINQENSDAAYTQPKVVIHTPKPIQQVFVPNFVKAPITPDMDRLTPIQKMRLEIYGTA